jgi:ATP sulfurylase
MIKPHGGELINRYVDDAEKQAALSQAKELFQLEIDDKNISDLEMIASGAMSPLTGFMTSKDYHTVVDTMHLTSGIVWSLPITLAVTGETLKKIDKKKKICLTDHNKEPLAVLTIEDIFEYDRKKEATKVFLTDDDQHPGVSYVYQQGNYYLGGPIQMLRKPAHENFLKYRLDPAETRAAFKDRDWDTIVAFQTRNPIHRAHEYLQKCALEMIDGLMIHPLVGRTKSDDIPAEVRMKSYEILLEKYYPKGRVMLVVFPAAMRYGGPKEAIFHAIVRKNYGCTHIIIGRDHAGVGNYYGSYDAQHIFQNFSREDLDISPINFEHAFFCKDCGNMASTKTCPHGKESHVFLSGTKVREMLSHGQLPPKEFTRPEVAQLLMESMIKD